MQDLKEMLDGVNNLKQCETDINNQFESIMNHDNELKKAVLLSFFAEHAMTQLEKIDTTPFVPQLKEILQKINEQYDHMQQCIKRHITLNNTVLQDMESMSENSDPSSWSDLRVLIEEAKSLIFQSDTELKKFIEKRSQLHLEQKIMQAPATK